MTHMDTDPEDTRNTLHKRSCKRCNQRKVKCNRKSPCTACAKAGESCIFPGDKRAPRQLNRPPVGELLTRLKELEAEVDELRPKDSSRSMLVENFSQIQEAPRKPASNAFSLLSQSGDIHGDWSPDEFRRQYLQPRQIERLWILHQENVAPLISIVHIPTTRQIITDAVNGVELDASHEALVLAICFSAVISMTAAQCQSEIGHEYEAARLNYELALERVLDSGNLLRAKDIIILQAAVLFLLCSRAGGNTRLVWAKAAVIVRLAQSLKLHKDGERQGFGLFETEMRRRLWWYICILDMLSSEDQDMDTQIRPDMFDTRYPSNINGEDLFPEMVSLPPEREGAFTDITHCIMSSTVLNEVYWSRALTDKSLSTPTDQEGLVTRVGKKLHQKYLRHFDLDMPLQWISATIIRLQLSRAWLLVQIPAENLLASESSRTSNATAFETAVESVNFSYLLQTNTVTTQWSWLCKSYKQWQIMAYLLSELCTRPLCAETDHAWDVVTKMLHQWQQNAQRHTAFEKSFTELVERTAAVRAAKLASRPSDRNDGIYEPETDNPFGVSELGISINWLREAGH